MTQEEVNEVLRKLCLEFGADFRLSAHEAEDGSDEINEDNIKLRIVVKVPNGRFRVVTIPLEDWVADYDKCLNEFRPVYKFMMGESEDGK